jgi:hypothetical protein
MSNSKKEEIILDELFSKMNIRSQQDMLDNLVWIQWQDEEEEQMREKSRIRQISKRRKSKSPTNSKSRGKRN